MRKVVTIDGPAGAGKSSVAKALAGTLGWSFLDTGAMYRVVTLAALEAGFDLENERALAELIDTLDARFEPHLIMLNHRDVTQEIRSPRVTRAARYAANAPAVREKLRLWQRAAAESDDIVTEGRDQGTIVFPDALAKFFLDASDTERARRRHQELIAKGHAVEFEEVLEDQRRRDHEDKSREIAPMRPADDAVRIDSTGKSLNEVLDEMAVLIMARIDH